MRIVYIGLKALKSDTVADTKLTWERGQIHEVADPKKAAQLLEHKSIWADADQPFKLLEIADIKPVTQTVKIEVPGAKFEIGKSAEELSAIARGELEAVFMTPSEKKLFEEFKAMDSATDPERPTTPPLHAKKQGKQLAAEM